nr:HlyD family type I secretion periplasmic adaptor subunit [uncultured Gellertiella sp.]
MIQEKMPVGGEPVLLNPAPKPKKPVNDGLARQIAIGYGLVGIMGVAIFGWAANTMINGAVVGSGRVIVESDEKLVQHAVGGVVGKIMATDGAHVREGDTLIRLNDTALKANLAIIDSELSALKARLARLRAERDGADKLSFPPEMLSASTAADVDSMRSETQFFTSRHKAKENRKQQLAQKIDQLKQQAKGYAILVDSRKRQWDLVDADLAISRDLLAKNLTTRSQVRALEQGSARLEGEYGSILTEKASILAQIAETELQITGVDEDTGTEVMKDLRDTEAKIAEDDARRINASDQLSRVDITAPASGIVHETVVHTIGGVINPGETIMKIVPENVALNMELRISPTDIDQVHLGEKVELKFPAFTRNKTPELDGTVILVGADASVDRQTGRSYYVIRVAPEADTRQKLKDKGIELVPGMPVEAFIETGERSTLSYLVKPVMDQIDRAFRED